MDLGIKEKYCRYEFIISDRTRYDILTDNYFTNSNNYVTITNDHDSMIEKYKELNGLGNVIMIRTHAVMAKGSGEEEIPIIPERV